MRYSLFFSAQICASKKVFIQVDDDREIGMLQQVVKNIQTLD
jgi:hypothetical protein